MPVCTHTRLRNYDTQSKCDYFMSLSSKQSIIHQQIFLTQMQTRQSFINYVHLLLSKEQIVKNHHYTVHQLHHSITVAVIQLCARMSTLNTPITNSSFCSNLHHLQKQFTKHLQVSLLSTYEMGNDGV